MANTNMGWQEESSCRDLPLSESEKFFPGRGQNAIHAVKFCEDSRCPVEKDCLLYALANDEKGVWGGMTEYDRKIVKRRFNKQTLSEYVVVSAEDPVVTVLTTYRAMAFFEDSEIPLDELEGPSEDELIAMRD